MGSSTSTSINEENGWYYIIWKREFDNKKRKNNSNRLTNAIRRFLLNPPNFITENVLINHSTYITDVRIYFFTV